MPVTAGGPAPLAPLTAPSGPFRPLTAPQGDAVPAGRAARARGQRSLAARRWRCCAPQRPSRPVTAPHRPSPPSPPLRAGDSCGPDWKRSRSRQCRCWGLRDRRRCPWWPGGNAGPAGCQGPGPPALRITETAPKRQIAPCQRAAGSDAGKLPSCLSVRIPWHFGATDVSSALAKVHRALMVLRLALGRSHPQPCRLKAGKSLRGPTVGTAQIGSVQMPVSE